MSGYGLGSFAADGYAVTEKFSERFGYADSEPEITIREDAPEDMRYAVAQIAEDLGLGPEELRTIICRVLLVAPDRGNWSPYPNIWDEVLRLLYSCPWYRVYDVAEAVYVRLNRLHERTWTEPAIHTRFEGELNDFFRQRGLGWQMREGHIEFRGPKPLEEELSLAKQMLEQSGRATSARELEEARSDLSRRPKPDTTGAIQHALAALECLARDVTGNQRATFGDLVRREQGLFPKPLDDAMQKLWGYSSEFGRHVREGREPDLAEAMLVVGLAASASAFLLEREREGHNL